MQLIKISTNKKPSGGQTTQGRRLPSTSCEVWFLLLTPAWSGAGLGVWESEANSRKAAPVFWAEQHYDSVRLRREYGRGPRI